MIVLFLTTLPTLRTYNSLHIQDYFEWFSVLRSSEVICSFLIKMSMQNVLKAIKIEITFFHFLGSSKGQAFDYFFCA